MIVYKLVNYNLYKDYKFRKENLLLTQLWFKQNFCIKDGRAWCPYLMELSKEPYSNIGFPL